jgi:multidrug efflux pump subunit AcrB
MNNPLDRLVRYSLGGGLPLTILLTSLLLGAIALKFTAREEEPQIVVPIVDVSVLAPGLSARQVERQVTTPLEKLLAQIPGVEHIYSTASSGRTSVTLRFFVGENREISILNTYNKLYSNQDKIPGVVTNWQVKPVEVDDVPILLLALWSNKPQQTSDYELRRIADEVSTLLQAVDNSSEVNVTGGRPRTIQILPTPESLASRNSTPSDVYNALMVSNRLISAGSYVLDNESMLLESGDFIRTVEELNTTVINVIDGNPVFLQDVATIIDGPSEPDSYSWIEFAKHHKQYSDQHTGYPMVTISVAKQRGSNAVRIAKDVHQLLAELRRDVLPSDVQIEVLRDYGETANAKVNQLTSSLAFAILTVVIFIAIFLGPRAAFVVGLTVPVTYGITLALDMAFGYTINRVTLFALILSLGLLVDDPITGVDNIERFFRRKDGSIKDRVVAAMSEIKIPLIMSTVTVVLAFIPLAYITGMMGPYMAPMAFNVPVAVITSTFIAFLVTPWLASKFLKPQPETPEKETQDNFLTRNYQKVLGPLLADRKKAKYTLWLVLGLFIVTAMLPLFRLVPLKLLPFDNKNEIQVVIDMPRTASLESTAAMAQQVSAIVRQLKEVRAIASFVGEPSPVDFNGLVRGYYRRQLQNMADIRITLVDKAEREHQSHGVVLRLREMLAPLNAGNVKISVIETPPGPPVMNTLVAEVYGSSHTPYSTLIDAAAVLADRLSREAFVTEIDTSAQSPQERLRFIVDKQKAALSGISTEDISMTLNMANDGIEVGYLNQERESKPLPITMRVPLPQRGTVEDLKRLQVKGRPGIVQESLSNGLKSAPQPLVAIGELGEFVTLEADSSIYHKDLSPVVYVTAEISGRTPVEVIADVNADQNTTASETSDWHNRTFFSMGAGDAWQVPEDVEISWTGEGEWKITVDVFRDMGLGYMVALFAIFFVLNYQTKSAALALIIMSAIPLTVIGIMPGFWLLNQFGERIIAGAPDQVLFTATAMIGMIALAGIAVRNSVILVEFITQAREEGLSIQDALMQAGSTRMRPILLTAGTTLLGNVVIILDPVFSGLALAIMFGIVASTLFTLIVVPVVYLLVFDDSTESGEVINAK